MVNHELRPARALGRLVAGATVAASALLFFAGSAAAAPDPSGSHGCAPFGLVSDDGLVTDVVHHQVEPLVPALPYSDVHALNCGVTELFLRQNLLKLPFRI